MRRLIIIGQHGMGKSSLGNLLLKQNIFTVGEQMSSVTKKLDSGKSNKYEVIDCPGFGDLTDEYIFFKQYLGRKAELINFAPINAIVLVVKFDEKESIGFGTAVKDFYSAFGHDGLQSVMLVCIQGKLNLNESDFKQCLYNSDGYKYLEGKKGGPIPFCLWDNLNPNRYPSQQQDFDNCLYFLQTFDEREMDNSFKLIVKQMEIMELKKNIQR